MKFIHAPHDPWQTRLGEDGPISHPQAYDHALLTLEQWHAVRDTWPSKLATGVIVPNTLDITVLAPDLPRLQLVALQFPKWIDGRAYSQARVLRSRLRFGGKNGGEVRAVGEVLVDMAPLLARCGFDTAKLRADQNIEAAQRALTYFVGHYQGDTAQPQPAFARDLGNELAQQRARREEEAAQFAGQGI